MAQRALAVGASLHRGRARVERRAARADRRATAVRAACRRGGGAARHRRARGGGAPAAAIRAQYADAARRGGRDAVAGRARARAVGAAHVVWRCAREQRRARQCGNVDSRLARDCADGQTMHASALSGDTGLTIQVRHYRTVYAISAARDCHRRECTAAPRRAGRPGRVGTGRAVVPGCSGSGECVRDPKF